MPIENGIGYGKSTPVKIEHLRRIFEMHLNITQSVVKKYGLRQIYRYVDLTAGRGNTPDGTLGSPIVFLQSAESPKFTLRYQADLIEHDEKNMSELQAAVRDYKHHGDVRFHCCDYQDAVMGIFKTVDRMEFGLVFVDPTGNTPDFDALGHIALFRPRMEILAYVTTTNVKRTRSLTGLNLEDYMNRVKKSHWHIRKPSRDQFRWTFLLGTNADIFKKYPKIGFVPLDSDEGKRIFEKLKYTEEEQMKHRQPPLF